MRTGKSLKKTINYIIENYLAPMCIAFGTAFVLFIYIIYIASRQIDTVATFSAFSSGLENYIDVLPPAWKARLFSNFLAFQVIQLPTNVPMLNSILHKIATYGNYFQLGVAFWTICWFLLISFVYVLDMKKYSILYILGTFAPLSFGYLRQVSERIFPWDMPALFIFTIFVLLFHQKKYWWIFVLIPVGMGFKETAGILCLVFLFTEMPWKQRLAMFFASVIFCIAVKFAIDLFVKEPTPFLTMEGVGTNLTFSHIVPNLRSLKTLIPLLINAGTFLAFILFPIDAKNIWALKTIAIAFLIGNLIFSSITEYRIWFEMIPFALYTFDVSLYGNRFMPIPETS